MAIELYHSDLPDGLNLGSSVAIDTETMGLNPNRDRLCLVQLSSGDGNAHLVKFGPGEIDAPNLCRLLADPDVEILFHFGRFDIAVMRKFLGTTARAVYCTKIASKLVRTYTDRHGLKDLCRELIGVELCAERLRFRPAVIGIGQIGARLLSPVHIWRKRNIAVRGVAIRN